MRTLIIYAFLALNIMSCENGAPVDYAIISGKINHNTESTITLKSKNTIDTIKVNSDGMFIDTLQITHPGFYRLGKDGLLGLGIQLYIEKGNQIDVSYDREDFNNTLSITSKGMKTSEYLYDKIEIKKRVIGNYAEAYALNENDYKKLLLKVKAQLITLLDANDSISEDFKSKEKRNLTYEYLYRLNEYKSRNSEVSNSFLDELKDLHYDNEEDYRFSSIYRKLVKQHYEKIAEDKIKQNATLPVGITYLETYGEILTESIKNPLLFSAATTLLDYYYIEDIDAFYNTYISLSSNDDNNKKIKEKYLELKTLGKGVPSPKFTNYQNYNGSATSLDDLKGKYVYIDVWATWCKPCKNEIPFLKKIEEAYHDKNIVFVSISTDRKSAHEKWRKMVADEALTGVQLFADNSFDSEFIAAYQIKAIPRFILIDPEGNIVTAKAPRPSDERLTMLFDQLL